MTPATDASQAQWREGLRPSARPPRRPSLRPMAPAGRPPSPRPARQARTLGARPKSAQSQRETGLGPACFRRAHAAVPGQKVSDGLITRVQSNPNVEPALRRLTFYSSPGEVSEGVLTSPTGAGTGGVSGPRRVLWPSAPGAPRREPKLKSTEVSLVRTTSLWTIHSLHRQDEIILLCLGCKL